jgi:hypothetical protein
MPQYFTKQPSENHDYDFDWTEWLAPTGGDTISASVVTADAGVTLGMKSASATIIKQFVSGGAHGTDYKVTCQITTTQGRVDEEEIYILVREI